MMMYIPSQVEFPTIIINIMHGNIYPEILVPKGVPEGHTPFCFLKSQGSKKWTFPLTRAANTRAR